MSHEEGCTKKSDTVKLSHTVPSAANDVISKAVSLLMQAMLKIFDNSSTFSNELNTPYEQNGLPTLNPTVFVPPS